MRHIFGFFVAMSLLLPSVAQAWEVPARGTATRAALMDAIRPTAEYFLGAPVQFVVYELRRSGNVAFAMLNAQRPGGVQINPATTPAVIRGEMDTQQDVTGLQAFYRLTNTGWVVEEYTIGATDVWFAAEPFCTRYRSLISDYC